MEAGSMFLRILETYSYTFIIKCKITYTSKKQEEIESS